MAQFLRKSGPGFWEIQGSIILGITSFHQFYNCDSQLRKISKSKPFRWRQTFRQIKFCSTSEAFVSCFFHQSEPVVLAARRQESCFNFVFEHACRCFFFQPPNTLNSMGRSLISGTHFECLFEVFLGLSFCQKCKTSRHFSKDPSLK